MLQLGGQRNGVNGPPVGAWLLTTATIACLIAVIALSARSLSRAVVIPRLEAELHRNRDDPGERRAWRLVEREVASRRRRSAVDPDGVRGAVAEARLVADELGELIARLETVQGAGASIDESQPVNDLSFR